MRPSSLCDSKKYFWLFSSLLALEVFEYSKLLRSMFIHYIIDASRNVYENSFYPENVSLIIWYACTRQFVFFYFIFLCVSFVDNASDGLAESQDGPSGWVGCGPPSPLANNAINAGSKFGKNLEDFSRLWPYMSFFFLSTFFLPPKSGFVCYALNRKRKLKRQVGTPLA